MITFENLKLAQIYCLTIFKFKFKSNFTIVILKFFIYDFIIEIYNLK